MELKAKENSFVHGAPISQDGIDHARCLWYDAPAFTIPIKLLVVSSYSIKFRGEAAENVAN